MLIIMTYCTLYIMCYIRLKMLWAFCRSGTADTRTIISCSRSSHISCVWQVSARSCLPLGKFVKLCMSSMQSHKCRHCDYFLPARLQLWGLSVKMGFVIGYEMKMRKGTVHNFKGCCSSCIYDTEHSIICSYPKLWLLQIVIRADPAWPGWCHTWLVLVQWNAVLSY